MTLEANGEELVDASEIADRLRLRSARTVLDLRVHRLGFPAPAARCGRRLMWLWSEVDMWATPDIVDLAPTLFRPDVASAR